MLSFYFRPSYSGSAIQALNLARKLTGRGVQSRFLSANLSGSPRDEIVEGMPVRRLRIARLGGLQIPSFWIGIAWTLFRERSNIDIIHAHGTLQHTIASLMGRLLRKPTILKIAMAGSDLAFDKQGRVFGRVNERLVRRFDCFIATSREIYDECIARGLAPERVHAIPNGVDTTMFVPAASKEAKKLLRDRMGLPDRPTVCFVGVLNARKNVDGILRIWRSARLRSGGCRLVLVGPWPRDGNPQENRYCQELLEFVRTHGLESEVAFVGPQADIAAYMRCSDIFLFPSRREGMPNVLLEAMASGLACVTSRAAGTSDLVQHARNGYIFDADDETGMADKVAELLLDPSEAERLGANARDTVERGFSLDETARRYAELYRRLALSSKSR
jgi:glycosyltransferase involved in cell wall biosynthesis